MTTSKSKAQRDPRTTDQDLRPEARAGRRETWLDQKNPLKVFGIELDPNYHYHAAIDDPTAIGGSKVDKLIRRGYSYVTRGEGAGLSDAGRDNSDGGDSRVRTPSGFTNQGKPVWQYLMKIPNEYYEEDKAQKEEFRKNRQLGHQVTGEEGSTVDIGTRESKTSITRNPGS